MVPTALVPAVRFHSDEALVWESADILEQLEERFPCDRTPAGPHASVPKGAHR